MLGKLLYVVYLAAFLTGVLLLFWLPYVRDLASIEVVPRGPLDFEQPPRHVDPDVMRQLGSVQTDRQSSFVHFDRQKPVGVQRVCALGDSFTYGDEVARDEDFPTRLSRLFHSRGWDHVQVLNFGSSWWGLHQSYLMWDGVAKGFDCDAIVLGPVTFFPVRDTRFNHTNRRSPHYLHARFVLNGDTTRLVEPVGRTHQQRFDAYFSFLPRWRYLRYDRESPAAFQSVVGRDRRLGNPFYYSGLPVEEEAFATYRLLVEQMAEGSSQVLLFNMKPEVVEMAAELNHSKLAVANSFSFTWAGADQENLFPYTASKGHHSVWGNQVLAEQLFAHLTAAADGQVDLLRFQDLDEIPQADVMSDPVSLEDVSRVEMALGDHFSGALRAANRRYLKRGLTVDFRKLGTRALLAIQGDGEDLVNAAWVPVSFPLSEGAQVLAHVDGRTQALGVVHRLGSGLPIGVLRTSGLFFDSREALRFRDSGPLRDPAARVEIDGRPVLVSGQGLDMTPVVGPLLNAVVQRTGGRPEALPPTGTVEMRLVTQGAVFALPIGRWHTEQVDVPELLRPVAAPLSRPTAKVAAREGAP